MYLKYIPLLALLFLFSCSNDADKGPVAFSGVEINKETKENKNVLSSSTFAASTVVEDAALDENGSSESEKINFVPFEVNNANVVFASNTGVEKKIIKNAQVKFQVKELNASSKNVEVLTKKYGAYISSSNQGTNYNNLYNTISIRVPAIQFEGLLNDLLKESIYLESKNITSQDVTEEYVDTETRIKTKKDIEQRYKEILRQAKTIEEILAVEAKLAEIREEIEAKEGRLKFLSDNVMYSTIQLEIYETVSGQVQPEYGFFSKLGEAITGGWSGLLSFFLGIVRIWPLLLILAIVLLIIRRWRNGRKKKTPSNL